MSLIDKLFYKTNENGKKSVSILKVLIIIVALIAILVVAVEGYEYMSTVPLDLTESKAVLTNETIYKVSGTSESGAVINVYSEELNVNKTVYAENDGYFDCGFNVPENVSEATINVTASHDIKQNSSKLMEITRQAPEVKEVVKVVNNNTNTKNTSNINVNGELDGDLVANPGDTVNMTLTITNNGNVDISNLVANNGKYSYTFPTLKPGASSTYSFTVPIPANTPDGDVITINPFNLKFTANNQQVTGISNDFDIYVFTDDDDNTTAQ